MASPEFRFNESISLMVNCDTQDELDYFWKELSADGEEGVVAGSKTNLDYLGR